MVDVVLSLLLLVLLFWGGGLGLGSTSDQGRYSFEGLEVGQILPWSLESEICAGIAWEVGVRLHKPCRSFTASPTYC